MALKDYTEFRHPGGEVFTHHEAEHMPVPVGANVIAEGKWEHAETWWNFATGAIEPRPDIMDTPHHVGVVGSSVTFDLPAGTAVRYPQIVEGNGTYQRVEVSGAIAFQFDEARTYEIWIEPPFPFKQANVTVEVSP